MSDTILGVYSKVASTRNVRLAALEFQPCDHSLMFRDAMHLLVQMAMIMFVTVHNSV